MKIEETQGSITHVHTRRDGIRQRSVLVAEANADLRLQITKLLEQHYRVKSVGDGAEALHAIHQSKPDIVLSGTTMPGIDGWSLLQVLKANEETKGIPVVVLSDEDEGSTHSLKFQDADAYMLKPFSQAELLVRLSKLLNIEKLESEPERRLRQVLDQLQLAVCVLRGADMIIESANESFFSSFRFTRHAIERPIREVMGKILNSNVLNALENVYRTGKPLHLPEETIPVAGNTNVPFRYVTIVCNPLREDDGRISGLLLQVSNTTFQVIASKKIEEKEKLYKEILKAIPLAIYACDAQGHIRLYNKAAVELWGREPVRGQTLWCGSMRAFTPDGQLLPLHHGPMATLIKTRKSSGNQQLVIERADGSLRSVIVHPELVHSAGGELLGAVNVVIDVSEKKQQEQALKESESLYRQLVEGVPVALYTCDEKGRIQLYNEAAVTLWGRTPDLEKDLWCGSAKIFHPDGSPMPLDACPMAIAIRDNRVITDQIVVERPDGTRRFVQANPKPIYDSHNRIIGAINLLIDITEQKQAALKVEESEERLRIATQSADLGTWNWTLQTNTLTVDDRCKELFGMASEEEATYDLFMSLVHQDDSDRLKKAIEAALQKDNDGSFDTEFRTIGKNDRMTRWIRSIGKAYRDEAGKNYRFTGTALDVTEQKLAEQRIRESEEMSRLAADAAGLGIWVFDLKTGITMTTDYHENIYGFKPKCKWGLNEYLTVIHPDDLPMVQAQRKLAETTGKVFYETRIVRPDKEIRWIRVSGKTLYSADQKPHRMLGTVMDITTQKLAKEQLEKTVEERTKELRKANRQLEKSNHELEQFAYIASHDLQEPLRKIQTFSSLLERNIQQEAAARKYFEKINESARRMSALISDVLNYSRLSKTKEQYRRIDLNELFDTLVTDFELSIKEKGARVKINKLPAVIGIPYQIHQLFSNLLGNSLKFCKENPVIEVAAKEVSSGDSLKDYPSVRRNKRYFAITVKDNGIGFEQKYADQIFTIFQRLNTREAYAGTGIGLALCKRIAENHKGHIRAQSIPDQGSTFEVILPIRK